MSDSGGPLRWGVLGVAKILNRLRPAFLASKTARVHAIASRCPDRASPPPGRAATTRSSASATPIQPTVQPGCDSPADGLLGPGAATHAFDLASLALGLDAAPASARRGRRRPALAVDPQRFGQA